MSTLAVVTLTAQTWQRASRPGSIRVHRRLSLGGGDRRRSAPDRAGEAGEGLARGETRGNGVADVGDTEAAGLAIGSNAFVYVEERVAGVPELEADGAWERRARRQK